MDLKNIRQNVFRYLIQKNRSALLDDCIALIIAEILGYINKRNAGDYKPWENICFGIKNYNTLNKNGLLEKIKTEILQNFPLEIKQEWLEAKAIYSFDMEYIVFADNFINIAKNQNYSLRKNYGEKDYSIATIKSKCAPSKIKINIAKETTKKNYFICHEEDELNKVWKNLETEERKKLFPFWKWRISTSEFTTLEEKLIALIKSKGQRFVTKQHSFKLALYYSEWYKRKYTGNDSVIDNTFEPISAQSVWSHLSELIQIKYLININKFKNNESTRWDDSLKLLGGLPLGYLTKGENNPSRVFAKLFNDFRNEKELDPNELDINNQAMRQSARQGGNIYEYIQELSCENYPFAESDKAESPFKEFIAFVETGLKEYKESKSKKFSLIWQVGQHPDFIYIYPTICVKLKPEESGEDHLFIYDKRLNDWGIQDTLSSFEIVIRLKYSDTDEQIVRGGFYFNRCNNGKFLCRSSAKWQICDEPKNLESIEFLLKSGDIEKIIQKEKIPNYIQVWNSGYGKWTNRLINGARSSVLFLNNNVFTKDDNQQLLLKSKKQEYYWTNIKSELLIISDGREQKLYQKNGSIDVYPQSKDLFKNTIRYNEDGMLSYVEEETTSFVYLVNERVELDVSYIDTNGSNKVQINPDAYSVQYRNPEMGSFMPYSSETSLVQGFVKFKITYDQIYEETLDCYVLKSEANIRRIIETQRVKFTEIETLELKNNELIDDGENIENDTINIRIGAKDNYLELPVFRPLRRENDIFQDGKHITNRGIIPIKYADSFVVRSINNEGVIRKVLATEIDKFQKIRVIYKNNWGIDAQTGIIGFPKLVSLTTYTKEISRDGTFFFLAEGKKISLESFNQYKFCFLSLKENQVEDLKLLTHKNGSHNYVGFFVCKEIEGILFQSFKDESISFQETYRPIFISANQSKIKNKFKQEDRKTRINNYKNNFDFALACNHFVLAIEHNLYFGMFDILLAMEDQPNILAQFYFHYYQHCADQKRPVDYKALHRLADELLFNWMLIPRKIWADIIINEEIKKDWVANLFNTKVLPTGLEQYALSQCCEKYWSSSLNVTNQNNILYTNIKRVKSLNSFFTKQPDVKITSLRELDTTENLYANLLKTLQK